MPAPCTLQQSGCSRLDCNRITSPLDTLVRHNLPLYVCNVLDVCYKPHCFEVNITVGVVDVSVLHESVLLHDLKTDENLSSGASVK